jgi:hypothetical protein
VAVDPFDVVPTSLDVEGDLKQIVHDLKRWEGLPLYALRALPSVRSWTPPSAARARYEGEPARRGSSAAIRQRIEEAITRTVLEEDWQALASIFTFDDPTLTLTKRQVEAAGYRGVEPESFRKDTEKVLLRELAEEMYRWELEQALCQTQSLNKTSDLDTSPSAAAQ